MVVKVFIEGPEGENGSWDSPVLGAGKWGFMHRDWDLTAKTNEKNENFEI